MPEVRDPRAQELSEEEIRERIAKRVAAEAAAKQADEQALIKTLTMAGMVLVGLFIGVVGLLWKENITIGIIGLVTAGIGGTVITVQQGLKFIGKE